MRTYCAPAFLRFSPSTRVTQNRSGRFCWRDRTAFGKLERVVDAGLFALACIGKRNMFIPRVIPAL